MTDTLFLLIFGYLLGSIPFGLLLTKLAGLGDVRSIGSGNIGATNVLRTGHKGLAVATLLLDAFKGVAPVLIAPHLFPAVDTHVIHPGAIAGLGAFLGHVFPIWLKFKGGKGVATSLGVIFALNWHAGLVITALWLAIAFISRISSLAALVSALFAPIMIYVSGPTQAWLPLLIMAALIYWAHRANIQRLRAGDEPKIGKK